MKQKLSCNPYVGDDVDICDNEKCTRELEKMVEAMKGAVAMDIVLFGWNFCSVSLFSRNRFTRKARLQLAARPSKVEHEQRAIPFGWALNPTQLFSSMRRCETLLFVGLEWFVTMANPKI